MKTVDSMNELKKENAEYEAVLDIISQVADYTHKRDVVEKLKQITVKLFGAEKVEYTDSASNTASFRELNRALFGKSSEDFIMGPADEGFILRLSNNGSIYGILEASEFKNPVYIPRYAGFANTIARVCGLAISNARQFEMLEKARDEVEYVSTHDSLTGLFNNDYILTYIMTTRVSATTMVFSFDIDDLKMVNEKFGHLSGNDLICLAADVLRECFRETDIIARIGGDEFIAIVEGCDAIFAEKIKKRIEEAIARKNFEKQGRMFDLSMSSGFAGASMKELRLKLSRGLESGAEWEILTKFAEEEMYAEKAIKKRNREMRRNLN